jgi:hypothetical protein
MDIISLISFFKRRPWAYPISYAVPMSFSFITPLSSRLDDPLMDVGGGSGFVGCVCLSLRLVLVLVLFLVLVLVLILFLLYVLYFILLILFAHMLYIDI